MESTQSGGFVQSKISAEEAMVKAANLLERAEEAMGSEVCPRPDTADSFTTIAMGWLAYASWRVSTIPK